MFISKDDSLAFLSSWYTKHRNRSRTNLKLQHPRNLTCGKQNYKCKITYSKRMLPFRMSISIWVHVCVKTLSLCCVYLCIIYKWQYLIAKERVLIAKLFPHRQFLATRACEVCPRVNTRASTLRIRKKDALLSEPCSSIKTEFRGPFLQNQF